MQKKEAPQLSWLSLEDVAGLDITLTTTSPKGILTLVFLLDGGNSYSPEANKNLISKFFLLQIRTRQKSNEIILFLEVSPKYPSLMGARCKSFV